MRQILVRIPWLNVPIFGFGAMLFVAFLSCTWLAGRRARREGIAPERIQDLAIWLIVSGLLGARVLFEIVEVRWNGWDNFFLELPKIWDGGIILYGSVIGGLLGYWVFYWFWLRRYHIPTLQLADIIAPSVALGIGLGRVGCFLNGCCYGQVACATCVAAGVPFPLSAPPRYALVQAGYQTAAGFTYAYDQPKEFVKIGHVEKDSPAERAGLRDGDLIESADGVPLFGKDDKFAEDKTGPGVAKTPADRLTLHLDSPEIRGRNELVLMVRHSLKDEPQRIVIVPWTLRLLPTQLYETVSMVLLFLLLTALYPLRRRQGLVTAVLMMGYAVHRALNEMLRADPRPGGLEAYFSYFLFAAGAALAVYVLVRGRKVGIDSPAPAEPVKIIPAGASA